MKVRKIKTKLSWESKAPTPRPLCWPCVSVQACPRLAHHFLTASPAAHYNLHHPTDVLPINNLWVHTRYDVTDTRAAYGFSHTSSTVRSSCRSATHEPARAQLPAHHWTPRTHYRHGAPVESTTSMHDVIGVAVGPVGVHSGSSDMAGHLRLTFHRCGHRSGAYARGLADGRRNNLAYF